MPDDPDAWAAALGLEPDPDRDPVAAHCRPHLIGHAFR